MLFKTIETVLKKLDGNIDVLPGHYMDWTEMSAQGSFVASLHVIIDNNRQIYDLENIDDFTEFIKANMREQPKVYAEIRKVNVGLIEPPEEEQEIMDVGKNECAASS